MRPGFTPSDGHQATAAAVIAAGLTLRLYAAAHTPALGDTVDSYRELEILGYGPAPLSASLDAWRLERQPNGAVLATYREEVIWRFALYGPTVHGYLVRLGRHLLGVQPFDAPFLIQNRGDSIALTPAIRFGPAAER